MIEIGKVQKLKICKKVDFGAYLSVSGEESGERVLLPKKEVPDNAMIGDEIKVFVYKDSEDRIISTTKRPYITMGHLAYLKVKEVSSIGAFLDWGLDKDLFLPFKEQTVLAQKGNSYLVRLYVDKSQRLCASMKLYEYLFTDHDYEKGEKVKGIIYEKSDNFGYFVAVDNIFSALIPKREAFGNLYVGKEIEARIVDVREDGKLTLAVRNKIPEQMNKDAEMIFDLINKKGGNLGFNDKAEPELIKHETGLSKAAFKRAVGNLLKQDKIMISNNNISIK